jgi:hypothetical protein
MDSLESRPDPFSRALAVGLVIASSDEGELRDLLIWARGVDASAALCMGEYRSAMGTLYRRPALSRTHWTNGHALGVRCVALEALDLSQ